MRTRSIGGSEPNSIPGAFARLGPANRTGLARSDQTGSTKMLWPAVWIRTDACPTAFDRDSVLAREITRLQQQFRTFDLARVYDVRLRTELRQYDTARGGYALGLGEDSFIPIRDPATSKDYGLEFRNTGDVNFIPVGDATAARTFAERSRLNTQGPLAGMVVLQMAFRLADAPPVVDQGGPLMVRADILAARVLNSSTGAVIYDFGLTPASRSPSGSSAERIAGGQAALKAADVQGLRLGMAQAEAEATPPGAGPPSAARSKQDRYPGSTTSRCAKTIGLLAAPSQTAPLPRWT